jgi:predicted ATP-grasp superfamily ATP-dependent carboligase
VRRCAGDLDYPQVVKGPTGSGSARVRFAATPAQLLERFAEVARLGETDGDPPPMLQDMIRGESVCYSGLFRDGRPLAEFMWRRLREYPATGGPTATGESIRDDEVRAHCRTLCEALRWSGPTAIEFKRDARDGVPRLMEINPRISGAVEFSIRCGVDFPRLYVDACRGRPFEPVLDYPVGRRLSFLSLRILLAVTSPAERLPLLRDLSRLDPFDVDWRDLRPTLRQTRAAWWDYRTLRRRGTPGS